MRQLAAILVDLRMPGLNGWQATAAIRREPGPNQHMPILAFTADGMMDSGEAGLSGFQGLIRKPTSPADMLLTLLRAVADEQEAHEPGVEDGTRCAAAS